MVHTHGHIYTDEWHNHMQAASLKQIFPSLKEDEAVIQSISTMESVFNSLQDGRLITLNYLHELRVHLIKKKKEERNNCAISVPSVL